MPQAGADWAMACRGSWRMPEEHTDCPARRLIVTTMRNEAPFILEWIAYHQIIGFTDFLVYTNDCDDGTDLILDRLAEIGPIVHHRNQRSGKKTVQWQALTQAYKQPIAQDADWIMVADVDEFLVISRGDGRLDDLFAACPHAKGYAIPWRMFGSAGRVSFEPGLVIRQFTRAAPDALIWPWRAVQFKSLFRNGPNIQRLGVHQPRLKTPPNSLDWVDGNGLPVNIQHGTVSLTGKPRYGLAQINHYALGSAESFLVKADRGKPNRSEDPIGLDYWLDRNFNDIEDTRILRHADAVQRAVDDMLTDAPLAELYQQGVDRRKKRIAELLKELEPFYLFTRLLQSGSTKVLPPEKQLELLRMLMPIVNKMPESET